MVQPGDKVLVKIVAFDGKHKLANKWEEDIYVVLKQPNPDIPVYTVKKQNGQGRERTLHRNLFFLLDFYQRIILFPQRFLHKQKGKQA